MEQTNDSGQSASLMQTNANQMVVRGNKFSHVVIDVSVQLATCKVSRVATSSPCGLKTLLLYEAQFIRDGVFNSRNSYNWTENNPHAIREAHSQHKFSVNVWCGYDLQQPNWPTYFSGKANYRSVFRFLIKFCT